MATVVVTFVTVYSHLGGVRRGGSSGTAAVVDVQPSEVPRNLAHVVTWYVRRLYSKLDTVSIRTQ